jgi:hypothetical protein
MGWAGGYAEMRHHHQPGWPHLADLVLRRDIDLTRLPWVATTPHLSRKRRALAGHQRRAACDDLGRP